MLTLPHVAIVVFLLTGVTAYSGIYMMRLGLVTTEVSSLATAESYHACVLLQFEYGILSSLPAVVVRLRRHSTQYWSADLSPLNQGLREELLEATAAWTEAINQHDVEKAALIYTEDCSMIAPGHGAHGRDGEDIDSYYTLRNLPHGLTA